VLVRSPDKASATADQGADVVVGDITDGTAIRAAVDGVTIVYHLAGRLLVAGIGAGEYLRTHVEGTRLLLAHCKAAPNLERFVHCSTTGVLGATGERPADESAPIRPTNIYEATKARAERTIRDSWRDGFPAVIARPGLVYGPGDDHLLPFFRSVQARRFRPIGRRPVRLHPIYIDDLTDALVRCGEYPAAIGECFHLAGRAPVTLAELAEAIAQAVGTHLPPGHIPMPAARALAAVGERLPPNLRRVAPLTRSRLEFLTYSRVYDVTKAQRLLEFSAPTALPAGVSQSVAWYRERGYLASSAERTNSWRVARAS
jgi:nucleoside-diphosphate-sugar epimerase